VAAGIASTLSAGAVGSPELSKLWKTLWKGKLALPPLQHNREAPPGLTLRIACSTHR